VQQRVLNWFTFIPNLVYREGHDRWKLDLAMPSELGDEPKPVIVLIQGDGTWYLWAEYQTYRANEGSFHR